MSYKSPIDEKKLIADLQNPSTAKSAFDELMRVYGEQIYWQIRKMVMNHNFRGDAKMSTWLYKIAVNESINFLNKERQRRGMTENGDDSFMLQNMESDEFIDGDSLQKELQKAIMNLPDKQRLVFNMRYYDEMKYEEMSEILGTSVGALKASYHHAVKKITAAIQDSEI